VRRPSRRAACGFFGYGSLFSCTRACVRQLTLPRVVGECRGAFELDAGFGRSPDLGEQVAPHGREQVVVAQRRFGREVGAMPPVASSAPAPIASSTNLPISSIICGLGGGVGTDSSPSV
jgi:hypothetical protein